METPLRIVSEIHVRPHTPLRRGLRPPAGRTVSDGMNEPNVDVALEDRRVRVSGERHSILNPGLDPAPMLVNGGEPVPFRSKTRR